MIYCSLPNGAPMPGHLWKWGSTCPPPRVQWCRRHCRTPGFPLASQLRLWNPTFNGVWWVLLKLHENGVSCAQETCAQMVLM